MNHIQIFHFALFLLVTFFSSEKIVAQVILTDSNLPIVIIDTENPNEEINQLYQVGTSLKIIYRGDGQTTYTSDQTNPNYQEYVGRAGLKVRGNSSADFPKKQYSVEFWDALDNSNAKSVLGMPKESDWVLQAPYFDRSLMRNIVGYQLSNEMGQYACRTKLCEVILDGEYMGIYVFMERIKIDEDRVNVEELDPLLDNSSPSITGGYVWRVDKGPTNYSDGFIISGGGKYRFFDPDVDNLSSQQKDYLEFEVTDFEAVMKSANYDDPLDGYASKIDVSTFVDQILLQEITDNLDAYRSSTYYHKYRNGKIRMGPVWDLNFGFGSYNQYGADTPSGWRMDELPTITAPFYNRDLFADPTFECLMNQRWFDLRQDGMPLDLDNVDAIIDSVYTLLNSGGAQERNFNRWPDLLGVQYNGFEAAGFQDRDTYLKEVEYLKQWIADRFFWMDSNMPSGNCPSLVPDGLVINEIMYNPSVNLVESEGDFEFIELYNNGNATIDLTGVQFSMGIHYTFQSGTIAPGEYLILAGNSLKFEERYGFAPFDQFLGGISNSGENVILADTYGFILDEVTYNDQLPWVILADGDGASLELRNPNDDNEIAENWFANITPYGSPGAQNIEEAINCDPEPPQIVINEINYKSSDTNNAGDWVELYNNSGSSVDLSLWTFQDEGAIYTIPVGTTIANNGFVVLTQDKLLFATQHLNILNVIGDIGFGLSNGGEQLSLVDDRGCTVDVVAYDDIAPWPTEPDGNGASLELSNVDSDNSIAIAWGASATNGGTPGAVNSNAIVSGGTGGSVGTGVSIRVKLEGFLNPATGLMSLNLNTNDLITNNQPYNTAPYNYAGTEQSNSLPSNAVDWVLVEIRSTSNINTVFDRKAFLLRNDGYLMDITGSTSLSFNISGTRYIAVYHRSHLGMLSSTPINLTGGNIDFTTSVDKADGIEQQKMVNGNAVMFAGDYDGNGLINSSDFNLWGSNSSAVQVYYTHDGDGNGLINNLDYNLWDVNKSKVGISEIQK